MEEYVELSPTEIQLGFVASCIEFVARRLGRSYDEIYRRMKRVGLIEKYIYPFYDVLHTYSREHVTDDLIGCLNDWEAA